MDYQGNSKKSKPAKPEASKKVEKVVTGEVVSKPKPLGRKFKDVFISADFKSVARYVTVDVLLPAFRNMVVDASTKGIERMMYGDASPRRRSAGYSGGPRVTYNDPINRGSRRPPDPSQRARRRGQNDLVLANRAEAEEVVERLSDIIDQFEVASVADLNDMCGLETSHVDNKWGWTYLGDAEVRQTREGYLIDLPPAEPI